MLDYPNRSGTCGGGRVMAVLWIAFYILFPVLVIYVCHRYPALKQVGGVVICYIFGLLFGNLEFLTGDRVNLLPKRFGGIQDMFFILTIGLALCLIFFSIDIRKWTRLAGKSLLSFGLQTVAVVVSVSTGYLIFRNMIGGETWKVGGMLIGCYTGGTVNLAAIGTALDVNKTVFASAQISDVAVGALLPPAGDNRAAEDTAQVPARVQARGIGRGEDGGTGLRFVRGFLQAPDPGATAGRAGTRGPDSRRRAGNDSRVPERL